MPFFTNKNFYAVHCKCINSKTNMPIGGCICECIGNCNSLKKYTNNNGICTFCCSPGIYTIRQVMAAKGFTRSEATFGVTISANGTILINGVVGDTCVFRNMPLF